MRILITGCRGQLGTELQKILHNGESELGPLPAYYAGAVVRPAGVDELDITDLRAAMRFVAETAPDVVINCAAYTNVDSCETHEDDAYAVNAAGAGNLASAAEAVGAKFVHLSTDYVFSGDSNIPYRVTDAPCPISVYGRTKLAGEKAVSAACIRHFVVRTAWLYGYTGRNFVKTILRLAEEKDMVTVVNDQWGNPTNANDLAYHLLKLAATEKYGLYHCTGNGGACTWYAFAREIIRLSGLNTEVCPCTSAEFPSPTRRPAYSVLDHTALDTAVGDEMRDWKEALAFYMRYRKE